VGAVLDMSAFATEVAWARAVQPVASAIAAKDKLIPDVTNLNWVVLLTIELNTTCPEHCCENKDYWLDLNIQYKLKLGESININCIDCT
jgi:hypothetical protein